MLDKSKADWQQMKATDAQLEEELEAHKKSGGQYLDKVRPRAAGQARWGVRCAAAVAACVAAAAPRRTRCLVRACLRAAAPAQHSGRSPVPPWTPTHARAHTAARTVRPQVDFLKRAELREYEKERDQRLAADVRNRGRL